MNRMPQVCVDLEPDLIAAATGEAEPATASRVQDHIRRCASCGNEYTRYRAIDQVVGTWREAPNSTEAVEGARKQLISRLTDLKHRTVTYRVFPSPLGNILIAQSEQGVSLIEYLGRAKSLAQSRLARIEGIEAIEDGAELEGLHRELLEYLEGKRTHLTWPVDLRLVRSDFHRSVLEATSGIPYGAVMSYAGVASEVGKPSATRAVAQALRWNPLPIVIPCHRVVGSSGTLTGYAGNKIDLKERLLTVEGVPTMPSERDRLIARPAMYVRHRHESEYCLPTCGSLPTRPLSEMTLFASRERAEAVGLEPCTSCRPDLHPLER